MPSVKLAPEKAAEDAATAMGAATYETYCAGCHGKAGKGDGPLASHLETRPSDLTTLSRRSGGRYPFERVYGAIDGRRPAKAHGAMPAWADAFRASGSSDDRAGVKEKITQLTRFVASIQSENVGAKEGSTWARCVFSNPALPERCRESVPLSGGSSAHEACEAVRACLGSTACVQLYCEATAIHEGWILVSADVVQR